ncbi:MAG: Calx-beta domain-containing protein, partial [Limisphaerales bacterium]
VRLKANSSIDTAFSADVNGAIQTAVSQTDDRVLVGGQFTAVDGTVLHYIARLMSDGSVDSSFDIGAGADDPVYALAETFINGVRNVYAGGAFNTINSVSSRGIARLNNNGTVDSSFNVGSGVDGTVYAIAAYPTNSIYAGDVIIGGSFNHYNGAVANGLARLDSNGSLDVGFNPGSGATNGVIDAIAIQTDGKVLVGGSFTNFDGFASTNIVRLNDDGSLDAGFAPNTGSGGANGTVDGIILQPDNRIVLVGQFSQFEGFVRNGVARLLPNGLNDPTINFGVGANGTVNAALIDPNYGLITLGGAFTAFNGAAANHIVQVYGLSETGSGAFEFSSPGYDVAANDIAAPVTILRVGGTSGPNPDGSGNVYVNFSTVANSGTAVAGVDYEPVSTNVAFPPGAVIQTVYVPVLPNPAATENLTVGLLLANATPPATVTNQPTALLTILNVNNSVSFSSTFTNISENVPGGIANISILRQGSTNGVSSVDFYTTTNGSAFAGVDFYPTNETITFNPGVSLQKAQVLIISNSTPEKTVGVLLTNPVNTVLFAPTNETLTILNNSTAPGQLLFAATNYTVNESAGSVTVYVERTNGFAGTVSYGYATVPGTALPNINYQPTNGTVTFNPQSTIEPITVLLSRFTPPENPVTFSIVLTNTTFTTASLVAPSNTTVTILDDVSAGVSFVNATNYFQESNGVVSVLVERQGDPNSAFSLPFSTANGTALAGVNYQANSGALTFVSGQTVGGISITLSNNEDVSNLTFGVSLSPPDNSAVELLSPSNALVVETPSAAGITLASPTNSVYKDVGSITIPVICMNPSNEPPILNSNSIPLTVAFTTTNGTGVAGVDYIATNGILTFTNGIMTNTITVPIINNSLISGRRTFSVNLFNVTPAPPGKLVAPTNDVITIIDSNSGLEFSSANYLIDSGGTVTVPVIRVDNTNTACSVAFATSGGSAIPNSDYYPTNGILTFAPGQISNSFNVTVIGSSAVEPDKTILLALSDATNAVLTAPSAATITIYNQNGSFIVPAGVSLPVTGGPAGGILQSNQPATFNFGFRDAGGLDVSTMSATLLPNPNIVPGSPATQNYGPLTVNGHAAFQAFTLTPIGTNGQIISANFQLQVKSVNNTTTIQTNS